MRRNGGPLLVTGSHRTLGVTTRRTFALSAALTALGRTLV
jgi:hypothetical protein